MWLEGEGEKEPAAADGTDDAENGDDQPRVFDCSVRMKALIGIEIDDVWPVAQDADRILDHQLGGIQAFASTVHDCHYAGYE